MIKDHHSGTNSGIIPLGQTTARRRLVTAQAEAVASVNARSAGGPTDPGAEFGGISGRGIGSHMIPNGSVGATQFVGDRQIEYAVL